MFFIGIFGVEDKQKEIKNIRSLSCKNCDSSSELTLFKYYTFFYFFFIPIFKWNIRYYLICSRCNSIYEISKEKGMKAEQGDESAITYWDLNKVNTAYYDNHGSNIYKCQNCGREIEAEFDYCPYCGKRKY